SPHSRARRRPALLRGLRASAGLPHPYLPHAQRGFPGGLYEAHQPASPGGHFSAPLRRPRRWFRLPGPTPFSDRTPPLNTAVAFTTGTALALPLVGVALPKIELRFSCRQLSTQIRIKESSNGRSEGVQGERASVRHEAR